MTNSSTIPTFQAVALMEALIGKRPGKAQALEILQGLREKVRQENIAYGQAMVQHARDNMTDAEWSAWVD